MLEFTINFTGMDWTDGKEAVSFKPADICIKADQQDIIAMKREDQTIQNITGMVLARFFDELSSKKIVERKGSDANSTESPCDGNFAEVVDTQEAKQTLYGIWKGIVGNLPKEFKKKAMNKYEADLTIKPKPTKKSDNSDEKDEETKFSFTLELASRITLTISNLTDFHTVYASIYDDGQVKINGMPEDAYADYIDDLNIPAEYKALCKGIGCAEKPAQ